MTDEAALLAAVVANPDDDTPRLVLADLLDDSGRPEDADRAEFIRVQVALARTDDGDPDRDRLVAREAALLERHRDAWTVPVERVLGGYATATGYRPAWGYPAFTRFRRGFVHELTLELPALLGHGERLVREVPTVRSVHLSGVRGRVAELAGCPALGHLHDLLVTSDSRGDGVLTPADLGVLGGSPHVHGLRTLWLSENAIGDEGVGVLASAPHLAGLRSLILFRVGAGPAGWQALADSPYLTQLGRLTVWRDDIGPGAAAALLSSPNAAHLEALHLDRCAVGDEGVLALARSAHPPRLRDLSLPANGLTDFAIEALAASPCVAGLRVLDLSSNRLGVEGVRALAGSPQLSGLRRLVLRGNQLDADGAAALVESPYLGELIRLDLQGNSLPGPALRALWDRFRDRVYL